MSLTNWDAFKESDLVYESDGQGNRISPEKPVLARGQFVARYRSNRCPDCNCPVFPGDLVQFKPNSKWVCHVTCIRSHSTTSSNSTNVKEMGRPVDAEQPIHTERNSNVG